MISLSSGSKCPSHTAGFNPSMCLRPDSRLISQEMIMNSALFENYKKMSESLNFESVFLEHYFCKDKNHRKAEVVL